MAEKCWAGEWKAFSMINSPAVHSPANLGFSSFRVKIVLNPQRLDLLGVLQVGTTRAPIVSLKFKL